MQTNHSVSPKVGNIYQGKTSGRLYVLGRVENGFVLVDIQSRINYAGIKAEIENVFGDDDEDFLCLTQIAPNIPK